MALTTKFLYEIENSIARIQFYTDDVFTNEWVAHYHDNISVIDVPTSPGIVVPRPIWKEARQNSSKWIVGITAVGLYFEENTCQSEFKLEFDQGLNTLKLELNMNDIFGVEHSLREMEYSKTTDMITIDPRPDAFTILWVDYINLLHIQEHFELLINKLFSRYD